MTGEAQHVRNMIEYVESQVAHGMKIGANMQEVADILAGAKMMLENGLINEAADMTNQALDLSNKILQDYKLLVTAIRRGKKRISEVAETGGVVEESARLLMEASIALERNDFQNGMRLANECINCLERDNSLPGILEKARPKLEE